MEKFGETRGGVGNNGMLEHKSGNIPHHLPKSTKTCQQMVVCPPWRLSE